MSQENERAGTTPWAARAHGALRIMTALLFLAHGAQKAFGFPVAYPFGPVQLLSLTGLAAVLELAGGILILLGLLTRPVAFVLSGMMAVAYFMAHAPRSFFPIVNQGEPAILFAFVFLFLAAAGPGAFSLDRMRGAKAARPQ